MIAGYTGRRLCATLLPNLDGSRLPSERRYVAPWVIGGPVAFLSGTLIVTWATYLTASWLRHTQSPMAYGNVIVLGVLVVILSVDLVRSRRHRRIEVSEVSALGHLHGSQSWVDIAVAATGLGLGAALMFHTCRLEGNTLVLGRTAFGDLNIHLGMARSFSFGSNFPTGYVAYAGSDIRYHFMFYFLVGNLEFLGLPIDWAINLPSILAFASVLMLLHALGSLIGRNRRVGALTALFFLMRSSPAAFFYVSQLSGGFLERLAAVLRSNRFIGLTAHEAWGVWNLNVYVVERHFGFAFGLVLISLVYLVRISGLDAGPSLLGHRLQGEHKRGSFPS